MESWTAGVRSVNSPSVGSRNQYGRWLEPKYRRTNWRALGEKRRRVPGAGHAAQGPGGARSGGETSRGHEPSVLGTVARPRAMLDDRSPQDGAMDRPSPQATRRDASPSGGSFALR